MTLSSPRGSLNHRLWFTSDHQPSYSTDTHPGTQWQASSQLLHGSLLFSNKATKRNFEVLAAHTQRPGSVETLWSHSALRGNLLRHQRAWPDWPDRAQRLRKINPAPRPFRPDVPRQRRGGVAQAHPSQ